MRSAKPEPFVEPGAGLVFTTRSVTARPVLAASSIKPLTTSVPMPRRWQRAVYEKLADEKRVVFHEALR